MRLLFKVLEPGGKPCHGGKGKWDLPTQQADGTWTPGKWRSVRGELRACHNGLHLIARLEDLINWLGPETYLAEYDGEIVEAEDKVVVRKARLLSKTPLDEKALRLFACDCAERVLGIYEKEFPDDKRPRQAVETSRAFARGEATAEQLAAARDAAGDAAWDAARAAAWDARDAAWDAWYAAWDAARDAAWDAARAAARAAAWDAAGDAAWDAARAAAWDAARDAAGDAAWDAWYAAWDAARDAERAWQTERLRYYLGLGPGRVAM